MLIVRESYSLIIRQGLLLYRFKDDGLAVCSCSRLNVALDSLTSDLLLQAEDDGHGLVEDQELGLGLVALEVELHHAPELLESLIDVSDPQAFTGVVSHPSLLLPLSLLLRGQVLIIVIAVGQKGGDIF